MFKEALLKKALQLYAGDHVLQRLLSEGEEALKIEAEKKRLTIFFQDIDAVTTTGKQLSPEVLVEFLNEYLNLMSESILTHNGVIDKYMGDAIMAIWGLNEKDSNPPKSACMCAIDCINKFKALIESYPQLHENDIKSSIGISTGFVVIGNMGSKKRINYTVMGDQVNLASRLQGINKIYKSKILISEFTADELDNTIKTKEVASVQVKGKIEPITLYALETKNL